MAAGLDGLAAPLSSGHQFLVGAAVFAALIVAGHIISP